MISKLTSAPAVPLTPEDQAICTGRSKGHTYSGVSSVATDAACTRAGIIYLMRKGDRLDFAKFLASLDTTFRDYPEKHFYRAFM